MSWLNKIKKACHRSELVLMDDALSWALGQEINDLSSIVNSAGLRYRREKNGYVGYAGDALYYADHFYALTRRPENKGRRIALSYYHGRPGSPGDEFTEVYEQLKLRRQEIERIRVTHAEMKQWMVDAGMPEEAVVQIPIGISAAQYPLIREGDRQRCREELGLPQSGFVIGSFQKDGTGWGDGMEPKLIKGPDIFLKVIEGVKHFVPELVVLLSGPARGYVQQGLDQLGIRYVHTQVESEREMVSCYHALDAYLITSRQEGGPKSLLESMATGVPVVSTRVGQCTEIVKHEENGWLVDVEDVAAITGCVEKIYGLNTAEREALQKRARHTAELHEHLGQIQLWKQLFRGFAPSL